MELASALRLVVRDLERTGGPALRVADESVTADPAYESVVLLSAQWPARTGLLAPREMSGAELVQHVADQVQEFVVEELWLAGRSTSWPECEEHPGTHPLEAQLVEDAAVWVCPKSGHTVADVGELS
ncbi:hypothetical protein [Kribbella sp. NPDC051770]|uniref:hypothetical protein n=1 Tax=Kribbella sp. NPDC051770 TaxID=3155413 RepID=UPI00343A081C